MSQAQFIADLDTDLHAAFVDAGMADTGEYLATPDATPVPCRVYVDANAITLGEFRQVAADAIEITYVLADVTPRKSGVLVMDGAAYRNVEQLSSDGSLSRWAVTRV